MATWHFWVFVAAFVGIGWALDHIHERLYEIVRILKEIRDSRSR